MIIAGNSHVSMFRGGLFLPDEGKDAKIHWVGALRFDQFKTGHPAAARIRKLFSSEPGWKFLCIGNHDVMALCETMAVNGNADGFHALMMDAMDVFRELGEGGKFGWMVCMQQVYEKPGMSGASILEIAKMFNSRLATWCRTMDIPVIDPSQKYSNLDGTVKKEWLQPDGLHLNSSAASFYLDEIGRKTGIKALPKHGEGKPVPDIAVATEVESFCALTAEELGLPRRAGETKVPSREELTGTILLKINAKLTERGLDPIQGDTDFVSEGLLDSLDLVEVYDASAALLGQNIEFDVDLRELPTAEKVSAFLLSKAAGSGAANGPGGDGPCQEDIFTSLNAEQAGNAHAAWSADARIARMGAECISRLSEMAKTVFGGDSPPYGVFYFWMALTEAREKRYSQAVPLGRHAAAVHHPFRPYRLQAYLDAWAVGKDPETPGEKSAPDPKSRPPGQAPAWEKAIPETIIRVVPIETTGSYPKGDPGEIIRRGESHFTEGRLEEAKICFWEALERIGMSDVVLNNLGAVFWQEKNSKDALGHFQLAMAWNPGNRDAILNLADAMVALGREAEARALVRKYLPSDVGNY